MSAPTKLRDESLTPQPARPTGNAPPAPVDEIDSDPFGVSPFGPGSRPLDWLLQPRLHGGVSRAVVLGLLAWLPLALLTAAEGHFWGADPRSAFLRDVSSHSRYLLALPLLALAESACVPRLSFIARHFERAALVPEEQLATFRSYLTSTRAVLESRRVSRLIVGFAYVMSVVTGWLLYPEGGDSWVATWSSGVREPTLAGLWRTLVSQSLLLYFAATWLLRLALWGRLLAQIARLDLRLVPAHPDEAGGLRFVGASLRPLAVLGAAFGAWAAGGAADRALYASWSLETIGQVVVAVVVIVVVLCAGPLFALVQPLRRARLRGLFTYGTLASSVGRQFEEQWLRDPRGVDASALSASDFSATTDLYSIVANVQGMRLAPLGLRDLVPLVVMTAVPFAPVALLAAPVEELLQLLGKLLR